MSKKDARQLTARLRKHGFLVEFTNSDHYAITAPDGATYTNGTTPSNGSVTRCRHWAEKHGLPHPHRKAP